jgi:hypothetical protein
VILPAKVVNINRKRGSSSIIYEPCSRQGLTAEGKAMLVLCTEKLALAINTCELAVAGRWLVLLCPSSVNEKHRLLAFEDVKKRSPKNAEIE